MDGAMEIARHSGKLRTDWSGIASSHYPKCDLLLRVVPPVRGHLITQQLSQKSSGPQGGAMGQWRLETLQKHKTLSDKIAFKQIWPLNMELNTDDHINNKIDRERELKTCSDSLLIA